MDSVLDENAGRGGRTQRRRKRGEEEEEEDFTRDGGTVLQVQYLQPREMCHSIQRTWGERSRPEREPSWIPFIAHTRCLA